MHVLVVGASIGGLTTVESLRAEGFGGRITLLGEEPHGPYHRPALSKQVLSGERGDAPIRRPGELAALDVELVLDRRATGMDPVRREVIAGGDRLSYDELVIATGAVARRPFARALVLRTLDDAHTLRDAFAGADRVAIVGAGVLGCELASAARARGCAVTLLARGDGASLGGAGSYLSDRVTTLLVDNGVEVITRTEVLDADESGVRLADGSSVRASVVVAAVGCDPAVEWLRGAGLDLADGVVCDANGRAAPGIHAVGDIAAWDDGAGGRPRRTEHQQSAIEQAQAVARSLTTGAASPPIEPFFWTTLFGTRILVHGRLRPDAALETIAGDADGDRFVLAARCGGRAAALVGWNMPREFRLARAALPIPERTLA